MRYSQSQMFSMIIISNLCGHFGGRAIANFTRAHEALFRDYLSLKFAPPSHVSFSTFINHTDETQMIAAFNKWTENYIPLSGDENISGDGKSLRSTVKDSNGSNQSFESVVSLFCHKSGLTYALASHSSGKSSEINVIRFLVNTLSGMGVTLFLDALHTQKNSTDHY